MCRVLGCYYSFMQGLTPDELTTITTYNKHAEAWVTFHDDEDFYKEEYVKLVSLLKGGTMLEIGCGAGRDAVKLTNLGYTYTGTDVAEKLIEAAQNRLPDGKFVLTDIYSMDFDIKFDGIWCAAVMLHIPRSRLAEALSAMNAQLRNGGIGFISTKQGDSDKLEPLSYDTSNKRLQVHYSKEEFDTALKEAGFKVVDYSFRPLSERAKWMCYFIQKI